MARAGNRTERCRWVGIISPQCARDNSDCCSLSLHYCASAAAALLLALVVVVELLHAIRALAV